MNPHYLKLAAANEILNAETCEQMRFVLLNYWSLFFANPLPSDDESFDTYYEVLRQRAFEFVTNHRISTIEVFGAWPRRPVNP